MTRISSLRAAVKGEHTQLGHARDNMGRLLSEQLIYLFQGGVGIFHHIMQQTGRNTDNVEVHVRQNARHRQGMVQIGFTGEANLTIVDFGGENIGTIDDVKIAIRVIPGNFIDYVVNTDHGIN